MIKTIALVLAAALCMAALFGCNRIDAERADALCTDYASAVLSRDEEGMKSLIHPGYIEKALPGDAFYETASKAYLNIGDEMTSLTAVAKNYSDDTELDGRVISCNYLAFIDELYYEFVFVILDNDEGYGIIAFSAALADMTEAA